MVQQFTVSQSNVICWFTGIHRGERQPKCHVWWMQIGHFSTERMPCDVCLNTSPGSYMNYTLTIKSWCTVSMTIPNKVIVKTLILLYSSWSILPTLTYKTQLASMWSISCNIQHLAQQQSQHKTQLSMFQKRTFPHFRWANTGNEDSNPHDNVIKSRQDTVAWRLNVSEHWEHCTAYDLKRSFWR